MKPVEILMSQHHNSTTTLRNLKCKEIQIALRASASIQSSDFSYNIKQELVLSSREVFVQTVRDGITSYSKRIQNKQLMNQQKISAQVKLTMTCINLGKLRK